MATFIWFQTSVHSWIRLLIYYSSRLCRKFHLFEHKNIHPVFMHLIFSKVRLYVNCQTLFSIWFRHQESKEKSHMWQKAIAYQFIRANLLNFFSFPIIFSFNLVLIYNFQVLWWHKRKKKLKHSYAANLVVQEVRSHLFTHSQLSKCI